ncbi:MAG: YdcH family protein [Nitrospinota bacterium]
MVTELDGLTESLRRRDETFSRLYDEHANLHQQIQELESRAYLSTQEELEIKRLKKLKLRVKDEMSQILKQYQNSKAS